VKIRGLWYHHPVLDDLRGRPSGRGGARKRTWEFRSDPRDRRFAFFQHPDDGQWLTLRWTGLPPEGEVPAFGDARAAELLKAAGEAGLAPKTDAELLAVLLGLIGGRVPVSAWPTQMARKKRTEHAREAAQGQAAQADRTARPRAPAAGEPWTGPGEATVTRLHREPGWARRARRASDGIDADRRRRREAAVPVTPKPPPPLGASYRERNVFVLPPDDEEDHDPAGQE
jgi:hypothetical protein